MNHETTSSTEPLYWKTWATLVALMVLNVASYFTANRPLIIFTAILVVLSATWVATTVFMHMAIEPRFIVYLCVVAVAVMGLFFTMVSPDVLRHRGTNWTNVAAHREIRRVQQEEAAHPDMF